MLVRIADEDHNTGLGDVVRKFHSRFLFWSPGLLSPNLPVNHGPAIVTSMNTFENPIIEARAETGMTLQNLGKRLGLSRQYISRAEQGTYSGLNKDLVKFTANQLGISAREVVRRYEAFQITTRRRTALNLNPEVLARNGSSDSGYILFGIWRGSYWPSTTSFSNGLCIHPETVRNYEEGITPAMPDPIQQALMSVNLIEPNWTELPTSRVTRPLNARVRA